MFKAVDRYEVAQDTKRIDRQMYGQNVRKNEKKIELLQTKEELRPKNLIQKSFQISLIS